jgi:selenocysteine lyase/cysteine desulfurase
MTANLFVPAEGIYLLNHSVGRMPTSARDHVGAQFFDAWENGTPDPWPLWMNALGEFNQALAELFNTNAEQFCPQTNISSAISKTLAALPKRDGKNVILMTENDFPSVGFTLKQAERLGFSVRFLPTEADPQSVDTWADALQDDVACALVTHVHFNTSRQIPVTEITRLTRDRGIFSIVDIAQSSGAVPIDLQQWQADVVVGSCVKWLCGGPGAGFMWVDADIVTSLEPADVGWFSHKDPFEFDIHNFEYADNASRFWGGTPSVLPYVVATNSIRQMHSIGIAKVREHNLRLTQKVLDSIDPEFAVTPIKQELRGGTLVLKFPRQDHVKAALDEAGVLFDVRPLGLRISPHIYNTEQEIDRVIECLKA